MEAAEYNNKRITSKIRSMNRQ